MPTLNWKPPLRRVRAPLPDSFTQGAADPSVAPAAGAWGPGDASGFAGGLAFQAVAPTSDRVLSAGPQLDTLVSFDGNPESVPNGGLYADAAGDLFGIAYGGPVGQAGRGPGVVFEIAKLAGGYSATPITIAKLPADAYNERVSDGSLVADAAGDLFGTTWAGGTAHDGAVFEIVKTQDGYASTPTILANFTGQDGVFPQGGVIIDAAGDLFGTTGIGGANKRGTVFELVKTEDGYASTPTTLVSFTAADGKQPQGGLIADAAGDLFGTTIGGGGSSGTVFEIVKTSGGYASSPTTLATFTTHHGEYPGGILVIDSAGDLFGTTGQGGDSGDGTVFEIAKIAGGYGARINLVRFGGTDGSGPNSLIIDAAGNIFGMTESGGADGKGTVFEIAKTSSGYKHSASMLVSFDGANGANPTGALIADSAGDLFGATSAGGIDNDGTAFEVTNCGFVVPPPAGFAQAMAAHGTSGSGAAQSASLVATIEPPTLLSTPRMH